MCACPACDVTQPNKRPAKNLRRAGFFAAAVALLAVVMALSRQSPAPAPAARTDAPFDTPDGAVAALVAAEQAADVAGYADCFAGELREKIEARMVEAAGDTFAEELRSRATNLTGHVTTDLQQPDADSAALVLERIFRNHNSRSRIRLRRYGSQWKIVEQTALDNFAPEIPYGTPVFEAPTGEKSQIPSTKSQTNSKLETGK
jgi:hypothetical protein